MAVPPLDHGIHGPGGNVIGLRQGDRNLNAVENVQYGDGDDEGQEKPIRYVDVLRLTPGDGADEVDGVGHPNDGDENIDGPLKFGVLVGRGHAQGESDRRSDDDRLPAPKGELR